ncbi:MAG: TIGR03621 family F420-dependent LLM class oxidoreductase [Actinomycetota bacterium]
MNHPVRFAYQITSSYDDDVIAAARRAEQLGFDVCVMADHVGPDRRAPLTTLAAVAASTRSIRLGTLVLNSDMRNPVQLAWEVSNLDHLSGGRMELGLGAGHTPQEYAATGIEMEAPAERKAAMIEMARLMRHLLDGDKVSVDGRRHTLTSAQVPRSVQERLPIMVAGNGSNVLQAAGAIADTVGLSGLGRTLEDGHRHEVRFAPDRVDAQVADIVTGAASAGRPPPEINALVQIAKVTDDPEAELAPVIERLGTTSFDELMTTPYVLVGTVDEIVAKIKRCNSRWGITYFALRALDEFAPVIESFARPVTWAKPILGS